ncbi:hypothetical protein LTR85_003798 [Meristemomyces frigidus]|nr:hypothetical protein LTR85_003798 [Meristemomyces frigidus]
MLGPLDLLVPPIVLVTSAVTFPYTLLILLLTGRLNTLVSWPKLKHTWFKHFWWWFGPASKPLFSADVRPLIAQARGVVLDIGPASGIWMRDLGDVAASGAVTKIYGVEPNASFHPQLRSAAKKYGLEDVYQIVPVLVEDLEAYGIEKGSIDTIITVHVLCSVGPNAGKIIGDLYEYLKPGGQWLVYEHVGSKHAAARMCQRVCNPLWGKLLDGCHLCRDTENWLKHAGRWESIAVHPDVKDGYFESLPHIFGRLTKES